MIKSPLETSLTGTVMRHADFSKTRTDLERRLKRAVPDHVWLELLDQGLPHAVENRDPEAWPTIREEAKKLLRVSDAACRSVGVSSGVDAAAGRGEAERPRPLVDAGSLLNPWEAEFRSALQTELARNSAGYPRVRSFRRRYLGGALLSSEDAVALLASPAARILRWRDFRRHGIPIRGHQARVVPDPLHEGGAERTEVR